jgi:hypothetical protein
MGEILGLGMTHYPPLTGVDENMAAILRRVQQDPGLPERYRDPASWPAPMRAEYGTDGGTASAAGRASPRPALRKARRMLDEFRPDVVVIWGDDQHENFKDDIIPPFCVLAMTIEARPWQRAGAAPGGTSPPTPRSASPGTAGPASTSRPGSSSRASTWRTPTSPCTTQASPTRS